jgi:hypothetical protein
MKGGSSREQNLRGRLERLERRSPDRSPEAIVDWRDILYGPPPLVEPDFIEEYIAATAAGTVVQGETFETFCARRRAEYRPWSAPAW